MIRLKSFTCLHFSSFPHSRSWICTSALVPASPGQCTRTFFVRYFGCALVKPRSCAKAHRPLSPSVLCSLVPRALTPCSSSNYSSLPTTFPTSCCSGALSSFCSSRLESGLFIPITFTFQSHLNKSKLNTNSRTTTSSKAPPKKKTKKQKKKKKQKQKKAPLKVQAQNQNRLSCELSQKKKKACRGRSPRTQSPPPTIVGTIVGTIVRPLRWTHSTIRQQSPNIG